MCGLFGFHLTDMPDKSDLVLLSAVLATLNDERGGDAWGYYSPQLSAPVKGTGLFGKSGVINQLGEFSSLIGHTRYKTVGVNTAENAHPFKIGNVIGAHNGGIFNHSELDKKYNRSFAVDSMHIFQHIEEGKWSLDDLTGYGTIQFYHKSHPNKLFLGRFQNGDLALALTPYGWVWSSNEKHLKIGLKMARFAIKNIFEPKETVLYSIEGKKLVKTEHRLMVKAGMRYSNMVSCDVWDDDYSGVYGIQQWRNEYPKKATQQHEKSDGVLRKKFVKSGGSRTIYSVVDGVVTKEATVEEEDSLVSSLANNSENPDGCSDCNKVAELCEVCSACDKCCRDTDVSIAMHERYDHEPPPKEVSFTKRVPNEFTCVGCQETAHIFCENESCFQCADCCRCPEPKVNFEGADNSIGEILEGWEQYYEDHKSRMN